MVRSNKTFEIKYKPLLIHRYMTEIKSNWLVISEAGNAVCLIILCCFIPVDLILGCGCMSVVVLFLVLSFSDVTVCLLTAAVHQRLNSLICSQSLCLVDYIVN